MNFFRQTLIFQMTVQCLKRLLAVANVHQGDFSLRNRYHIVEAADLPLGLALLNAVKKE